MSSNSNIMLEPQMKVNIRQFTTPQVAGILDLPMRKLLSYVERGYVKPSIQDASGHGSRRLWDTLDIVRIYTIRQCEKMGLSVNLMRHLGKMLSNRDFLLGSGMIRINQYGDYIPPGESFEDNIQGDPEPGPWLFIPVEHIRNRVFEWTESYE